MTPEARDAALDELRAELARVFRRHWAWRRQERRDRRLRPLIAKIRALDAIREHARDRAYMAALWMYLACGFDRAEAAKRACADIAENAA